MYCLMSHFFLSISFSHTSHLHYVCICILCFCQNLLLLFMSAILENYILIKEITDKLTVNWIMMRLLSRDQLWSGNRDEASEDMYQRMSNVHTKQRESEIIWLLLSHFITTRVINSLADSTTFQRYLVKF